MTILLTFMILALGGVSFYLFKLTLSLKENLKEFTEHFEHTVAPTIENARDNMIDPNAWGTMINNISTLDDNLKVINESIPDTVNKYVGEALENVDFDLERYNMTINSLTQAYGKLKERLDALAPLPKKSIDPAENLKHQANLMDAMLYDTTIKYAEALKKNEKANPDLILQVPEQFRDLEINNHTDIEIEEDTKLVDKYQAKLQELMKKEDEEKLNQVDNLEIPFFHTNSVEDTQEIIDVTKRYFDRTEA